MDLVLEVKQVLRDKRLLHAGDTVICAVSGGADSMALLHVLHRLSAEMKLRLVAAHINHGFRKEESAHEAEVVRSFTEQLGIPLAYYQEDVPAYASEHGLNAQAAAREVRYRLLERCANDWSASVIALAHHQDDQAETVLLNMLSGSALTGLTGMPWSRLWNNNMKRIRPLLRITKQAIFAYAAEFDIPYCTDSSNELTKYERNRLRITIMPQLLSFNPNLPQTLSRMAEILHDEDAYMASQTRELEQRIVTREQGAYIIDRGDLQAEPIALQRRLIKLILNYLAEDARFADYSKVESIRTAIDSVTTPSLTLDLGAGIRFERVYEQLTWRKIDHTEQFGKASAPYSYVLDVEAGQLLLPEAGGLLITEIASWSGEHGSPKLSPNEAVFDADLLQGPLIVRSRKDGDRIALLGLNGTKKVKDMFIDLKVHPDWRDRAPIVVDADNRLLWIPGMKRSCHAMLSAQTTRIMRLIFEVSKG